MLVLQTILPALSMCQTPSEITLHGGTHNPLAPTFEFVRDAYLPLLKRLGFNAAITLERFGFYPRGGGLVRASIEPLRTGNALDLVERGPVQARSADVLLAGLPVHIAQRELSVLRARLGLSDVDCSVRNVVAHGAGNAVHVRIDSANVTAVFAGFGVRGVAAEKVASQVAGEVERYLAANVAVDAHLADQLLLPMVLAAGGRFSTLRPSVHSGTNAAVIQQFLPVSSEMRELEPERWLIDLRPRARVSAPEPPSQAGRH
jgi:RNA 3'-terminal phosphate cyclase (ATP)